MRSIVLCDVDGVIVDLATEVHREAEELFCRRMPPPETWHQYDFGDAMGLTPREMSQLLAILRGQDDLARIAHFYPGATAFIRRIQQFGHEVVFVTKEWEGMPSWRVHRREMLRNEFGGVSVLFLEEKHRIIGDVLVDDLVANVQRNGARGLLFDRPWNRDETADGLVRVRGYEDTINQISRIFEAKEKAA